MIKAGTKMKATKIKRTIGRLYIKSGQLPLLRCQVTSLKNFCVGSLAVAEVVKVIAKHNKFSAGVLSF